MFLKAQKHLRSYRGFTLTEIAIVLGVLGFIISGIWSAVSGIYLKMDVNKTIKNMNQMQLSVKNFYAGRNPVELTENDRYVTYAIGSANYIPKDLTFIRGNPADEFSSMAQESALGRYYRISVQSVGATLPASYKIEAYGLSPAVCSHLATQLVANRNNESWGIWIAGQLFYLQQISDGRPSNNPPTDEDIDRQCQVTNFPTCNGASCLIMGYFFESPN